MADDSITLSASLIKDLRLAARLKVRHVASALHFSCQALYAWESGRRVMPEAAVERYLDFIYRQLAYHERRRSCLQQFLDCWRGLHAERASTARAAYPDLNASWA